MPDMGDGSQCRIAIPVIMANRHTVEFFWISHNGDGRLGHNGEKEGGRPIAANTVQRRFYVTCPLTQGYNINIPCTLTMYT